MAASHELALGFIEADLVAVGSDAAVRGAIDARRENRNVVSNNELMRLVAELDNSNAWAVGRFDALANEANLPERDRRPDSRDLLVLRGRPHQRRRERRVQGRDQRRRVRAEPARRRPRLPRARQDAGRQQAGHAARWSTRCSLSGDGKTVALAFSVPTEVLDVIEAMGKAHKNGRQLKQQ